MDISVFLAKVLGPYLFVMAIVLYANMRKFKAMLNEGNVPFFMFVSGAKSLLFGLLIVSCHNIWEADWKVVITILGWFLVIRGILRLFCPDHVYKVVQKVINSPSAFCIVALIVLIIGAYLSYFGYMVS